MSTVMADIVSPRDIPTVALEDVVFLIGVGQAGTLVKVPVDEVTPEPEPEPEPDP